MIDDPEPHYYAPILSTVPTSIESALFFSGRKTVHFLREIIQDLDLGYMTVLIMNYLTSTRNKLEIKTPTRLLMPPHWRESQNRHERDIGTTTWYEYKL